MNKVYHWYWTLLYELIKSTIKNIIYIIKYYI